jgi:hypothetical protein
MPNWVTWSMTMIRKSRLYIGCRWSQASKVVAYWCSGDETRYRQTRNGWEHICKKRNKSLSKKIGNTSPHGEVSVGGLRLLKVLKNTANHLFLVYYQVLLELRYQKSFDIDQEKYDEASLVMMKQEGDAWRRCVQVVEYKLQCCPCDICKPCM